LKFFSNLQLCHVSYPETLLPLARPTEVTTAEWTQHNIVDYSMSADQPITAVEENAEHYFTSLCSSDIFF